MNSTENSEVDCEQEALNRSVVAFVYSGIALGVSYLILICTIIAWISLRKTIYIRRRGFSTLTVLSIAWVFQLFIAPGIRVNNNQDNILRICYMRNFWYIAVVPLLLVHNIVRLVMFINRAALNKRLGEERQGEKRKSIMETNRFYSSEKFQNLIALVGTSIVFLVAIVLSFSSCEDCAFLNVGAFYFIIPQLVAIFILFVVIMVVHRSLRKYPDPLYLLRELRTGALVTFLLLIPTFILVFTQPGDPLLQPTVSLEYSMVLDLVLSFYFIYNLTYQCYLAHKYKYGTFVYEEYSLEKVLADPVGKELLRNHLVEEFSIENLNFIEDVQALREKDNLSLEDLNQISKKYLKDLNIGSTLKQEITEQLENHEAEPEADIFDDIYEEIFMLVETDSFPRFKRSVAFEKYTGVELRRTLGPGDMPPI